MKFMTDLFHSLHSFPSPKPRITYCTLNVYLLIPDLHIYLVYNPTQVDNLSSRTLFSQLEYIKKLPISL